MSEHQGRRKSASGNNGRPTRGNDVGYCRPPKKHQFKPGRSGNPKGRPRGAKNEATILRDIMNRPIAIREGGRTRKVPVLAAVLLRFAEEALKGNPKAAAFLLNRYRSLEGAAPESNEIDPDDQQILDEFARNPRGSPQDQRRRLMNSHHQRISHDQMISHDQALLDAVLRSEFESFLRRCLATLNPGMPFLPNWHIKAIAYQLERIRRGEINRLIINMPPRHLKSLTVSVAFPACLLGLEPKHRIFAISYGSELSSKHASDFRSIAQSSWYARAFPKMRITRSLEEEVITSKRGFRKATSVAGPLTGLGGNIFIIDDPQKPADAQSQSRRTTLNQWVSNTLMSRLDNKETGVIIVVMQRVHTDDLSGFLANASDDWTVLSLPAIAEDEQHIPIGDHEFYHRGVGEALHPAHDSSCSRG
jgi:hypothetical protein